MIPGIPLTNNSSTTTQLLTLTLGGAATTTYPTASVYSYIIPPQAKTVTSAQGYIAADASEYRRAPEFTLLTAATKTTIAAAPPSGSVKMVTGVSIHNPDTVSMTMTVAIDDNGTTRVQWKGILLTLETLFYGNGHWYCMDVNGAIKNSAQILLDYGTYTPTLTGVTNVTASTSRLASWFRVGDKVTVAGQIDVDPTLAALTQIDLSLPIASNFSTALQAGGTGAYSVVDNAACLFQSSAANDRVECYFTPVTITNSTMTYIFSYQIL